MTSRDAELEGRVACVTGGGSGIGRAIAHELAAAGAFVVVADIDEAAADRVAEEIGSVRAVGRRVDVGDTAEVDGLFAAVAAHERRLDILINNAGIYPRERFETSTVDVFDRIMRVNVRGVFLCTAAALPLMSGGGSIVFLSSGAATLAAVADPLAGTLPLYGASKAAVDRWALGVARELGARGVAANVLYPGVVVRTAGTSRLELTPEELAAGEDPDFVAPAAAWLARQRPDTFTGRLVRAVEFGKTWGPGAIATAAR